MIRVVDIELADPLLHCSNPAVAQRRAKQLFGPKTILYKSTRPTKKYMILNPQTDKFVHFGQMGSEDYTYHRDQERRQRYLTRSGHIKGDWKENPYSPNNLSRNILW